MERLTVKRPDGRWAIASSDNASPTERVMKIPAVIDRLAAYEDTGLEPEEITTAFQGKKAIFDLCFSVDQKRIAHLLELLQAEQAGRLVVLDEPRLPLIWGDDDHDTILCPNCGQDLMGGFELADTCEVKIVQCPYYGQSIDGTKALTREEAEKALRGGNNDA